jgi:hypothetical protein
MGDSHSVRVGYERDMTVDDVKNDSIVRSGLPGVSRGSVGAYSSSVVFSSLSRYIWTALLGLRMSMRWKAW